MFPSNAPDNYICPICLGTQHIENEHTLMKQADIVYADDMVTVFVNSFFLGKNAGHVIVVPNDHYENVYELPSEVGHHIFDIAKEMAVVMKKVYKTDGITIRQNNEPAGDQHAFHYHLHVFPRYTSDDFNEILPEQKRLADPEERAQYADKLKLSLASQPQHKQHQQQ